MADSSAPTVWLDAEGNIDWDASAYEAQEYNRRWEELDYWVHVEAAAELHTIDVLMGRGTPPVARVRAFNPEYDDVEGAGWVISPEFFGGVA
jgi:hypothetical protein